MRRPHRGFTLVELLVVIAIIGMLAALILPAVGRARESARTAQCANNLKQLADAMLHYESTKNQIPAFVTDINTSANNGTKITVNWPVLLLPYMSRNDVYTAIQATTVNTVPRIDSYVCPSAPPPTTAVTPMTYVANCGREDNVIVNIGMPNSYPFDYQENGVFFNQGSGAKALYSSAPTTTISYINKWDGATNTVAFSENLDVLTWWPTWLALPLTAASAFTPPATGSVGYGQGAEWAAGMVWFGGTDRNYIASSLPYGWLAPGDVIPFNGTATATLHQAAIQLNKNALQSGNDIRYARPSSLHIAGFNMAFCDGHVGFVSENVQYRVYTLLMTPRGNGALDPYPQTIGGSGSPVAAYTFSDPNMYWGTGGTPYAGSNIGWMSWVTTPPSTTPYAPGSGVTPPIVTPLTATDLSP